MGMEANLKLTLSDQAGNILDVFDSDIDPEVFAALQRLPLAPKVAARIEEALIHADAEEND